MYQCFVRTATKSGQLWGKSKNSISKLNVRNPGILGLGNLFAVQIPISNGLTIDRSFSGGCFSGAATGT